MKKRHLIYTLLLCLFIGLNYIDLWSNLFSEFDNTLLYATDPPVFLGSFQLWIFSIIGIVIDAFIVAVVVGIFTYFFRSFKAYVYILFGMLIRYFAVITRIIIYTPSLTELRNMFLKEGSFPVYFLLLLQFSSVIIASYIGYQYAKKIEFFDKKDEDLYYLYGISKKVWFLVIISFNPVIRFLTKFSIVHIYRFTNIISSREFWENPFLNILTKGILAGGFIALIYHLFLLFLVWIIAGAIFFYGLNVIRSKKTKYKPLKIIPIFVLLPLLLLIIPIIRNKTWFF